MAWNYERSLERIRKKRDEVADVEVSKLTREMDFQNVSLKHAKQVYGAHAYIDVANSDEVVSEAFGEGTEPELLRRLHIYTREITRVVESDFPAAKVHFQGAKLHLVVYRPIDDEQAIAKLAAVMAAAVHRTVVETVNPLFDGLSFELASGIDIGDAVATKNSVRGDRELLFLGRPANMAAKVVADGISLTSRVADGLPSEWHEFLTEQACGALELGLPDEIIDQVVSDEGWGWSIDQCKERLEDALESFPRGCATIHDAQGEIDKSKLRLSNSKRVEGVSVFADIDGFTEYVDDASASDSGLVEAVRAYHIIRSEMRFVAVDDCGALRVQYQGDRMQAIVFLPIDDHEKVVLGSIELAGGLHSSMSETLPQFVGEAAKDVAIGEAFGRAVLTRLGEHGQADVMCLGTATSDAEAIQLRLDGRETGVTRAVRELLPQDLAQEFKWVAARSCYIAKDLTADKIDRATEAENLDRGEVGSVAATRLRGTSDGRPWQA